MSENVRGLRRWCMTVGVATLAITGCGGNGGESQGDSTPGDDPVPAADADLSQFTIAWNAQPPTLDPAVTTSSVTASIGRNIFEPLIVPDENGDLQPVLAESWDVSEDSSTIVFTIRGDVVFHDGTELSADDVAASLNRWMELSNAGQAFFGGAEAEVTGELEVTLDLGRPMFAALHMIGGQTYSAPIMPASVVEDAPESGVENERIIGTGPYRLVEWATDQHIKLSLNEDYSPAPGDPSGFAGDRSGTYENLVYEIVPDSSTAVSGVQTGEYDAANEIPFDNAELIENDPNVEMVVNESNLFSAAIINKAEGPLSDVRMRRAVNAALDFESIMMAGYVDDRFYSLNGSLAFEESTWHTEAGYEHYNPSDPDLAQELMDEAGYDGEPIRIITSRDYEQDYHTAVMMSQQLEDAGMNVELIVVDWATVMEIREDTSAHEMSITKFTFQEVPGSYPFFTENYTGWTDDEAIFGAVESIIYSPDEETALGAADELQEAFYEYLPILKIGDVNTMTAIRSGLSGYQPPQGASDMFYRVYPVEE